MRPRYSVNSMARRGSSSSTVSFEIPHFLIFLSKKINRISEDCFRPAVAVGRKEIMPLFLSDEFSRLVLNKRNSCAIQITRADRNISCLLDRLIDNKWIYESNIVLRPGEPSTQDCCSYAI